MTWPAWTAAYVGLPFVDGGRDVDGLDCWGLVKLVLEREFAITGLPDFRDRYEHTRDRAIEQVFREQMQRWQRVADPRAGDVAVLQYAGRPMHVGLVVADNWMLTIDRGTASCLERIDDPRWKGKLEGYYRYGDPRA